jgi:hypothetical protein
MASESVLQERSASVLDADPGLAAALVAGGAGGLAVAPLLPVLTIAAGDWPAPDRGTLGPETTWLVVLAGWLRHDAGEVMGPGDTVDPWSDGGAWRACTPARLAVIGAAWRAMLADVPEGGEAHVSPRARPLRVGACAGEAPEERLLDLLWQLAARWARPGAGGPALPRELDAAAVAGIAGVPRDQADAWLATLLAGGTLQRGGDGCWQLPPPRREAGGLHARRDALRARMAEQLALARAVTQDARLLRRELEATCEAGSRRRPSRARRPSL